MKLLKIIFAYFKANHDNQVTHEVFFGENLKRLKNVFRNKA